MPSPVHSFVVVARSASGVYFRPNDSLLVKNYPTSYGPLEIRLGTRRARLGGFSKTLPRGIYADIRGNAPDLDTAMNTFVQAARTLCPILSLAANAPIEDLEVELAYESTTGLRERSFFQRFLPDERLMPIRRRVISSALASNLITAVAPHSSSERLHRTMVHYYQALQEWRPGRETFALAHLYMGVETITPSARNSYIAANGLSREKLMEDWQIKPKELDPQIRKRLIFKNDLETYKRAKEASDGFEHGYLPFQEIQAEALATNNKTAAYLRQAIFEQLLLSKDEIESFLAQPYDQPFYLDYTKNIRGTLEGNGELLASPNQDYPFLKWRSSVQEIPTETSDDPRMRFVESFDPQLNTNIRFIPNRLEIWGPAINGTPDSDEITVPQIDYPARQSSTAGFGGIEWNKPELEPLISAMTKFLINFGAVDLFSRQWMAALTEGESTGDDMTFLERVDNLIERINSTELADERKGECKEVWLSTLAIGAMQDSIARSPLLFRWHGIETSKSPDFAMMIRRASPHWPQSPEPTIMLEELLRATDEAAATAAKLLALGNEMDTLTSPAT